MTSSDGYSDEPDRYSDEPLTAAERTYVFADLDHHYYDFVSALRWAEKVTTYLYEWVLEKCLSRPEPVLDWFDAVRALEGEDALAAAQNWNRVLRRNLKDISDALRAPPPLPFDGATTIDDIASYFEEGFGHPSAFAESLDNRSVDEHVRGLAATSHSAFLDYLCRWARHRIADGELTVAPDDAQLRRTAPFKSLLGESPAMLRTVDLALRVAERVRGAVQTDKDETGGLWAPVLLLGETGSGKDLLARAIAETVFGSSDPKWLVTQNCAAIPESLSDVLLHGCKQGMHSTALRDEPGILRRAAGRALFLDEVHRMPRTGQDSLLRFLESWEVHPIGEEPAQVKTVVIAACNADSLAEAEGSGLIPDLLYRLANSTIRLPPLRKRGSDFELLLRHFEAECRVDPDSTLTPDETKLMSRYSWPGNVRQLRQLVRRRALYAGPSSGLPACDACRVPGHAHGQSVLARDKQGHPVLNKLGHPVPDREVLRAAARRMVEGGYPYPDIGRHFGVTKNPQHFVANLRRGDERRGDWKARIGRPKGRRTRASRKRRGPGAADGST